MWWKKNKWKVIIPVVIVAALAAAFYFGGNTPSSKGWVVSAPSGGTVTASSSAPSSEAAQSASVSTELSAPDGSDGGYTAAPPEVENERQGGSEWENGVLTTVTDSGGTTGAYLTDPVPEGMPQPVEPQDVTIGTTEFHCTISINCSTILNNLDYCDPEKVELVPADGWVLQPINVVFYEGESVFNVLQRVCKQNSIHFEFTNTPIYNSAYIEGIANLYEFDVGELSGWMYSVNGWFPNYGCGRYQVKDGDVIRIVYTCDLGADVGNAFQQPQTD